MYSNIQLIGKGAYGKAYLAENTKTNENVVIKKIYLLPGIDKSLYTRELKALQRISKKKCFPQLLCLKYFYIDKNHLVLVTNHFKGITLNTLIKNGHTFSKYEIKHIMYHLLIAIYILHEKFNMAHLDIKPDNIIIDSNNQVSLIDFGISCIKDACNVTGTYGYMAPEVITAYKSNTKLTLNVLKQSDIFSLGVVFYELIKQQNPIYHLKNVEDIKNVIDVFQPSIIKQMMSYNPNERPNINKLIHYIPNNFEQTIPFKNKFRRNKKKDIKVLLNL